jgi:hypothetical protein
MLPTPARHPDRSPQTHPPARQLALPLAPAAAPLPLPALGPPVPPRRAWRSLAPPAQAAVRRAVARVYEDVLEALRPVEPVDPEEVTREQPVARR